MIRFFNPANKYGEFSNFYKSPITWDGKMYPTSEHLYQCLKFPDFPEYQEIIRTAKTPNMAKIIARQKVGGGYAWRTSLNKYIQEGLSKGVRPHSDWELFKESIMQFVLILKFQQHPRLLKLLLSTESLEIGEDSPYDMVWGMHGKNLLGKILMDLRTRFREKA